MKRKKQNEPEIVTAAQAAPAEVEASTDERALLAAVVHHGGGVERVNKAFFEGVGSRLVLDIEHEEDAFVLRTRVAATP